MALSDVVHQFLYDEPLLINKSKFGFS